MDWPVVFRTHSEIEASIVRGLLETHGIDSIPSAGPAPSTFPFSDGLVEVRVAVPPELADQALRIIAEHREQVPAGVVLSLGQSLALLERRIGYRFRDTGHARARADPQVQGARGRHRRRGRQRVARVPRRRGAGLRDCRPALSRVPAVPGRAEVEGQGGDGLDGGAGGAGRAHRAGRVPAARPRGREDRRAPQAGAAGRRLRGAHRGALSRRRHRGRARVPAQRSWPTRSRTSGRPTSCATTSRRCRNGCSHRAGRCRSTS